MPCRGAGEQRADRLDRLAIAPDDTPDIGLSHNEPKHGRIAAGALGDDDFVGELNQMTNHELEELFHALSVAPVGRLSWQ